MPRDAAFAHGRQAGQFAHDFGAPALELIREIYGRLLGKSSIYYYTERGQKREKYANPLLCRAPPPCLGSDLAGLSNGFWCIKPMSLLYIIR